MPKAMRVEHVQVGRDGAVCIRLQKQVTLGGQIHSSSPHLHWVAPGQDLDESLGILAECLRVNDWPPPPDDDLAFVRAQHAALSAFLAGSPA